MLCYPVPEARLSPFIKSRKVMKLVGERGEETHLTRFYPPSQINLQSSPAFDVVMPHIHGDILHNCCVEKSQIGGRKLSSLDLQNRSEICADLEPDSMRSEPRLLVW